MMFPVSSVFADCYEKVCIAVVDIPEISEDFKSFGIIIREDLNFAAQPVELIPDFFNPDKNYTTLAGIGNERRIMLNTACSEPVACLQA